jgi:hypothetical protein
MTSEQQLFPQPNVLHFDLHDGPLTEDELARLAWLDLFGHMKDICDTLNGGGCLGWFYLPQDAKLIYEKPSPTEHKIIYRVGASEYVFRLYVDFDLRFLRYSFDPCPVTFQRMIAIRGEQAYFSNRDSAPDGDKTMEDAAAALMLEFLLLDDGAGQLDAGSAGAA